MWTFVGFLIAAFIAGYIFRLAAALLETLIVMPWIISKSGNIERAMEQRPKTFITAVLLKNVIIGLANSVMILYITVYFVDVYDGNQWLYFSVGVIWSLFIITDQQSFTLVFLWTSTINFILLWFGFGWLGLILVGLITFLVSIAFYYGRIGTLQQMYREEPEPAPDYSQYR